MCVYKYVEGTIHCDDCDVCILGHDHHCIFFSKCIGSGNIYPFWGSMGLLLLNFAMIMFFFVSFT